MGFREVEFPDELAFGSGGGPMFRTHIVVTKGGGEQRNQCWSQALRVYEISMQGRETALRQRLHRFFRAIAGGKLNGFRFYDRRPGESVGTREWLGEGDGVTTEFQAVKHYILGPYDRTRTIYKLVDATTLVYLDDVSTGAFTVDITTGLITLTSAPAVGVVARASFQFRVPVRFDTDWMDLQRKDLNATDWPAVRLVETRAIA